MASMLLALLLMAQAPVPQTVGAAKGVIKGSVIAADTGAPIVGVRVIARSVTPVPPGATPPNPAGVTTDDRGNFEIPALDPGSYGVIVDSGGLGYSRQVYGSPRPGADGMAELKPISLRAGQTVEGIVVALSRGGTISGRVLGATGQPFVDAEVRIHRPRFDESGPRGFVGEGLPVKVNDRGEFRFFGLDPGAVYLHAGPQIGIIFEGPGGEVSRYAEATYYPRAASFSTATPIEIKPGSELTNMDIQLLPRPAVFAIRGRMLDSRTGQPAANVQPLLVPRDRQVGNLRQYPPQYGPDGTFTLIDVPEGEYWISAQLRPPMPPPQPGERLTAPPPGLFAFQRITVRGADVSGVSLTFAPSVQVSGRVKTEGALPSGVFVQLDVVRNGSFPMNMGASPRAVAVNSDGTFSIPEVPQGEYRVKVSGLPAGVQAKEARLGAVDALVDAVSIGAAPPERMEISVVRADGRVQGQLVNAQNQPVANAQVVLIPNTARGRVDLYKTATSDASGGFNLTGLLPGEYKAFSWASLTPFRYFDQEFVASVENRGEPVLVEEGTTKNITVRRIP